MRESRALHRFALFVGIFAIGLGGAAGQSPGPSAQAKATSRRR
jgi:hypothetical protein